MLSSQVHRATFDKAGDTPTVAKQYSDLNF